MGKVSGTDGRWRWLLHRREERERDRVKVRVRLIPCRKGKMSP